MPRSGLTTSEQFLVKAAAKYFNNIYENPSMYFSQEIDPTLGWQPSLYFKANDYLTIAAEASETPYPAIFRLRHADIVNVNMPISIYCICPEEAYLNESMQRDVMDLESHGYGLLTVNSTGTVNKRVNCIPLIQHLSEPEFTAEIKALPKKIRLRLKDAFESYKHNPGSGVKDLSEVIEALILDAGKKAAKKCWITKGAVKGSLATLLDEMTAAKQCHKAKAAIGGARSYIYDYRNTSHHIPRNKKQAYKKYNDCLHAFRDGIKRIQSFRDAFKNIGINVSI